MNTPNQHPAQRPTVRPGLPVPAAEYAAERHDRLPINETLLDAREATPAIDDQALDALRLMLTAPTAAETIALIAEIDRLRAIEAERIALLEEAAYEEASRWDMKLKYGVRRIDEDCYLPWSGSGDSPADYGLMTRPQALARGWLPRHLDAADARDNLTDYFHNRCGPREACLTREAIKEAFASREAGKAFRLTPDKIQPHTTSGGVNPATGEWDDSYVHWVPWAPDEVPDTLPDGMRDHY